ncbi:hypothetical protein HMPREF0290_0119, partial [Corynebacterium efficiens YS-314]
RREDAGGIRRRGGATWRGRPLRCLSTRPHRPAIAVEDGPTLAVTGEIALST